jgi:hypothetical protein
MLRKFIFVAAIASMMVAPAFAQICPVSNKVPEAGDGIGDGCSTKYKGVDFTYLVPGLAVYNSVFRSACDKHDKCWTQLGANYPGCDSQFLSDMKDRCDSAFNKFLMPAENLNCKTMANTYKEAVTYYRTSLAPGTAAGFQYEARNRSIALESSVNADSCGTTPPGTTLYAPAFITQVQNVFVSTAGRNPTIYEFLAAVNQGDLVADPAGWNAGVVARAQQAAANPPPSVGWYLTMPDDYTVRLNATPVLSGTNYLWRVSAGGGTGSSVTYSFWPPLFNRKVLFQGFIKATNASTGIRNMAIIDTSVTLAGTCAPNNGPNVNCQ